MASEARTTGLTWNDLLEMFPEEDKVKRELIRGELFVTPSGSVRHERVVMRLSRALWRYEEEHGGEAFGSPLDTMLSPSDVVEPDVMYFSEESSRRIVERPVEVPPDLAIEVSSPSTRKRDRTIKRDLYARGGVPEYWFVDLDADRIEVSRLEEGRYGEPGIYGRGEQIESRALPGFSIAVDDILGPTQD